MNQTYADAQIAIYDDVLSPEHYAALWTELQHLAYERVHARGQQGVWRIQDGAPLQGPTTAYSAIPAAQLVDGTAPPFDVDPAGLGIGLYPTGTALDPALAAVVAAAPDVAALIGAQGTDWLVLTASPWIYPAGTRLSWHEDAIGYSGAFVFYTHPRWNVQWGGELLIADDSVRAARGANAARDPALLTRLQRLDNPVENAELSSFGLGRFIVPKPNRLVFLSAGTPHMIAQITASAGDNVRTSLGGFFVDAAGIAGFLSALQR